MQLKSNQFQSVTEIAVLYTNAFIPVYTLQFTNQSPQNQYIASGVLHEYSGICI